MAATCPIGFDIASLREQVRRTYERVAREPAGEFHFHRGPDYAAEYLGYHREELATLPPIATARFAGVGNPVAIGPVAPGEVVLDHACGAGTDLLLAARRVGRRGRAIGIDMTEAMRKCAADAARQAGLSEMVEIRAGMFEELPLEQAVVDVVISNGVVNLSPNKPQVFREIHRVLKPGGRLYLADVIVQRELMLDARSNPELWAACIGGALPEGELYQLTAEAGLTNGKIVGRFACFRNTAAEKKVARDLEVHGVNFFAEKSAG
jgi:ubiquinone/menaquinone biosynthesis C-methylase UbiE